MLNLKALQLQKQKVFKAMELNAEKNSQLRNHLRLNNQARELLVTEVERLERLIALLDSRLTVIPNNTPIEYKKMTFKPGRDLKKLRGSIKRHLNKLSSDEARNFIDDLATT
jgi:hypothetical protein